MLVWGKKTAALIACSLMRCSLAKNHEGAGMLLHFSTFISTDIKTGWVSESFIHFQVVMNMFYNSQVDGTSLVFRGKTFQSFERFHKLHLTELIYNFTKYMFQFHGSGHL